MKKKIIAATATLCLAALIVIPSFMNDYFLHIGIMIMFYAYVSQSWNIMSGFSGQFSFGHAAFYGIGAYASSILAIKLGLNPWLGMFVGAGCAMLVGLFIGFLSFRYRLKGAYFTLATLAFAEICRIIVENTEFLNKTMGVLIPLKTGVMNFQFDSRQGYFYVMALFLGLIALLAYGISRTRLGFNLAAIRGRTRTLLSLWG